MLKATNPSSLLWRERKAATNEHGDYINLQAQESWAGCVGSDGTNGKVMVSWQQVTALRTIFSGHSRSLSGIRNSPDQCADDTRDAPSDTQL